MNNHPDYPCPNPQCIDRQEVGNEARASFPASGCNMKKITLSFLIIALGGWCAFAQTKQKTPKSELPAGMARLGGDYSDTLLNNSVVKMRLRKLLGKKNYASFYESFETLTPIEKKGQFLLTSGCLIHACTHLESAIVIDLVNKTIHAAIFRRNEKTKYFNENGRRTPKALKDWGDRLAALQ